MSASGINGSYAPNTVVPEVALTKNGIFLSARAFRISFSNSHGIILPVQSEGTFINKKLSVNNNKYLNNNKSDNYQIVCS